MKEKIKENLQTVNYKKIEIIENNWQKFPWKLDYLFYILYSTDKPTDIIFPINNDTHSITNVTSRALQTCAIELNHLTISKGELFLLLNMNSLDDFANSTYKTSIFNNNLLFRVQKTKVITRQLLAFRFLDTGIKIDLLFNEKIEKFQQYYNLSEKLAMKNIEEKVRKI